MHSHFHPHISSQLAFSWLAPQVALRLPGSPNPSLVPPSGSTLGHPVIAYVISLTILIFRLCRAVNMDMHSLLNELGTYSED